jgi:hypothetical protein
VFCLKFSVALMCALTCNAEIAVNLTLDLRQANGDRIVASRSNGQIRQLLKSPSA